jgi:putative ABC transport system ATP-binding protein
MINDSEFIVVRDLKRHFRLGDTIVRALDGIDLTVKRGEFLCLMGPSGSGKSTLMHLLGGLDSPNEGEIIIGGQVISELDDNALALFRQKRVGYVFQSFNLIPSMTALQNVEFPMIFAGMAPAERRTRAESLLTQVGLGERMDHKPTQMSGGQQQRVAMARALVNEPQILLGDEPTGNLDSKTGEEILEMLVNINKAGQTVILVTHDPRVATHATRTIHMLDGHIVEDETHSVSAAH